MGVNAQTAVPAFVASEVLTAAEMTQVNTGIPVFATTVTRDAAFGGAGEKVLAEGQFAYIEATNTTQYYDGSAWVAVGASGLTYITGAAFTGVTSVQVNDCFTSAYRNYRIYIEAVGNSIGNMLSMRLSLSGTPSTTNYQSGLNSYDYNSGGAWVFSTTSDRTQVLFIDSSGAGTALCGAFVDVLRPQLPTQTDFLSLNNGISSGVRIAGGICVGKHNAATGYDGMTLLNSAGTNMTGNYRIYGLADS